MCQAKLIIGTSSFNLQPAESVIALALLNGHTALKKQFYFCFYVVAWCLMPPLFKAGSLVLDLVSLTFVLKPGHLSCFVIYPASL
jgi:hypothetical protein